MACLGRVRVHSHASTSVYPVHGLTRVLGGDRKVMAKRAGLRVGPCDHLAIWLGTSEVRTGWGLSFDNV